MRAGVVAPGPLQDPGQGCPVPAAPTTRALQLKGGTPVTDGAGGEEWRGEVSLPLSELLLLNQTIQSRWKRVGSWEGRRRKSRR